MTHWTCTVLEQILNQFGAAQVAKATGSKTRTLLRYSRGGKGYESGVPAKTFLKVLNLRLSQVITQE